MCIRDSIKLGDTKITQANVRIIAATNRDLKKEIETGLFRDCLLYTSDAADDLLCVDLGGRRIIKKKNSSQ